MANLNKVMLMGNLTRDPEIRYTPKGRAVSDIGLAINRVYTTESGEKREETTFVDITLWGRQAEIVKEYCGKGRPLYVEGWLQMDTWDDKQTGQKRSKLKVVADNIQLLGSRQGGGAPPPQSSYSDDSAPAEPRQTSRPPLSRPKPADPDLDPAEDDIPF